MPTTSGKNIEALGQTMQSKLLRMTMQLSLENGNNGNSSWVGNVATIFNNG